VTYPTAEASGAVFRNIGTTRGPSATLHGDRIMLAWKDAEGDSEIYFSLFDGNQVTGQTRLPGVGTSQGPGICCGIGASAPSESGTLCHGAGGHERGERPQRALMLSILSGVVAQSLYGVSIHPLPRHRRPGEPVARRSVSSRARLPEGLLSPLAQGLGGP
jgi:hypothetical protein